jgi:NAD(P)-dependent dehydrogenase (short-subunit alcohol dehydrogenase family)
MRVLAGMSPWRHFKGESILSITTRPGDRRDGVRRRVLVTGAANGVGLACARALAGPATALFLADYDAPALQRAGLELGATTLFCDVASEAGVAIFAADLRRLTGSLDLLINAAGPSYVRTLGTMRICRELLPLMKKDSRPKDLVNVAQLTAPPANCPFPYAASTHAFAALSDALADQLRGTSVRLTTVLPSEARDRGDLPSLLHRGGLNRRLFADTPDPAVLADRMVHFLGYGAGPAERRDSSPVANRRAAGGRC